MRSGSNTFLTTVAFNICCPRDCVSRHNGGTSGAPLKPLRVDSALNAIRQKASGSGRPGSLMEIIAHELAV